MKTSTKSWTLERELCKVAKSTNVNDALYALGLLARRVAHFELIDSTWVRGGAETYLDRFQCIKRDDGSLDVLIKACTTFSTSTRLEEILLGWIERRELLAENSITTPTLYGWGSGVIIEEYVPFEVKTLLKKTLEPPQPILNDLAVYAATLSRLGFSPGDPFSDLRSHGNDVVVVDFGQDLGPPGELCGSQPYLFHMLQNYLVSIDVSLPAHSYDRMRAIFIAHGGGIFQ